MRTQANETGSVGDTRLPAGVRSHTIVLRSRRARLLVATTALACAAFTPAAMAQTVAEPVTVAKMPQSKSGNTASSGTVENVNVTGHVDNSSPAVVAPTRAPLEAIQPTSVIGRQYIAQNVPLTGSFVDVIKLAPSTFSVDQNGPGLGEGHTYIRGFADGQYNVLFDGIPFQDVNNFTHHTTSYFMPHDLEQVSVDRGPGEASTVGTATFGGTISLVTKDPSPVRLATPYASGGSWSTWLAGTQLDSGAVKSANGARLMVDVEHGESDGATSYAGQERTNVFGKLIAPLTPNTTLTAVGMFNAVRQYTDRGASRAQIAKYGPDYALSENPHSQSFYKYNEDPVHTDFEYLGLNSRLDDGWTLNDKLYTYGYDHYSNAATDVSGNTKNGTIYDAINGIPGQPSKSTYRAFGNVLNVAKKFRFVDVRFGAWAEKNSASRNGYEADLAHNDQPNPASSKAIDDMMHLGLVTVQPYVEADLHITPRLTFTPGLRYDFVGRTINAVVNQSTKLPLTYAKDYNQALPNFALHYSFSDKWAAYAQAAEGFLAPQSNYFYVKDPSRNTLSPQKTWNYQIGTSWQSHGLSLSGDLYYIDFNNLVSSRTVGAVTYYANQGGVNYYGIEAEATVALGYGVSLYANGSVNRAKVKSTGLWIADAPDATAAGGLIYSHGRYYASLLDKWVGSQFGDTNQKQGIDPFNQLDLALGYQLGRLSPKAPPVSVKLQLDNLTDSRKIIALAGYSGGSSTPLYYVQPGRSVFVSVEAPF